ncbi:MAG: 4-hydroxy-tetrahydrodipicolinate synthase [Pseudomonadota bacterium]
MGFEGSIPALVTPFKDNAIDRDTYVKLIERQIQAGSGALVPVGTTGESATLSHAEHREAVSLCLGAAAGRVPVIAGCGSNSTAEAIGLVEHAKEEGADAVLVVCPYYNKPDQEGLYAHFKAVNDAVAIPIVLYNVPGRTSCDLQPDTVGRLAKLGNVIGIKDATGDLSRVTLHRQLAGDDFIQLSGDDPSALGFCAMGGAGGISVTANVAPELSAKLYAAVREGDLKAAQAIDKKLRGLHTGLFASPSPGPTKYALSRLGLCSETVRLPITPPNEAARAVVDAALAQAGLIEG